MGPHPQCPHDLGKSRGPQRSHSSTALSAQRSGHFEACPTSGRGSGTNPSRFGILTRGRVVASMTSCSRRHGEAFAPNLLARQCGVARPAHVWVGDSSEVWTAEGWWSVSTLWDVSARHVVGWAMSRRIETMLVEDTVRMALGRRQPAAGLRPQSDRGSQYASHTYQDLLATQGIVCRLRRPGACLDNAVAERCFGS